MGEFSGFALVPEQGAAPKMEQLDAAMQARIRETAARLNIHDGAAVLGFGARAQKEMGAFSDIALAQVLRRDVEPLGSAMRELAQQIKSCSFSAEAKGFLRRMFGGAAGLEEIRAAYEKAVPRINACADEMTDRRVALMRDSALLDRLYERNETLYRELCSLIVVGDEIIRQARERGEDAQIIARMERRVQDIRVTQLASTQLAAQIRMVQASDSVTCEKLKTALEVTIPLWKGQMAAALGLARATDSLTMQRRMNKEAMRGVRAGAKELTAQKNAYAKADRESDRERAQQTAQDLLRELESIEQELGKKAGSGLEGGR
ncbi:MAG: toxic anion resistance protein [Clostridia bacterium]|nr:toxic anion resistance protein [Clostridia bacterium]